MNKREKTKKELNFTSEKLEARILSVKDNFLNGWAIDNASRDEPVIVQVFLNDTFIIEQAANLPCLELEGLGLQHTDYGFNIGLPLIALNKDCNISIKDKKSQKIIGIVARSHFEPNSKNLVLLTAGLTRTETAGQFGCIDRIDEKGISGWYINLSSPEEIPAIDIYLNDQKLGTVYPALFRPDLATLVDKPTYSGFNLTWGGAKITPELKSLLKSSDGDIHIFAKVRGHNSALVYTSKNVQHDEIRNWISQIVAPPSSMRVLQEVVKSHIASETPDSSTETDVKAIAFYLPQYHPVPENDEWWGPGFTEWANVTQGKPNFLGHDQPRIPADLGYYDLRLAEVREKQVELAKQNGIYGFCYYYYWFEGRRILERPLEEIIASGKPDFPFCICWANETWSRRWDGSENEVLLKQNHTFENDVKFIHDVIPLFKDPRYIRVNDAPLLVIYRTELFPDPLKTADIWRKICREEGIGEIHLCAVESFGFNSPLSIGYDSSVQFPPHGITSEEVSSSVKNLDPEFSGKIYDYEEVVASEVNKESPLYPRYPGVMCGWDNTARRKKASHIFLNASPELYEVWLRSAVDKVKVALPPENQFIFINAWNEWAEGTYLEPDKENGYGYLHATKRAMRGTSNWKQLLDYAKKRDTFNGDALKDLIRNFETELISQDRSLKYLKKIHKNTLHDTSLRVVISNRVPMQINSLPQYSAGHGNIDRINTASVSRETLLAIPKDRWIFLTGWVTVPQVDVTENSSAYVVLECMRTRARYYGLLNSRDARRDIVDAFPNRPSSETHFAGFSCYLDVRQVHFDQYRIGIVQLADSGNFVTFFNGVYDLV
jgi:hypothetical protein